MRRIFFWALVGATLAVYGAMVVWTLPVISAGAGGLAPFDMRPGGYDFAAAQQFLAALSPEAAAFYDNVQHKFDLAYPALAALTLFFALAALLPRELGILRFALAAPTALVAIFDYLENHAVAGMLAAGPSGLTPTMVEAASRWTILKSGATTVAMTLLLALLLWRGIAALRRRTRNQPNRRTM